MPMEEEGMPSSGARSGLESIPSLLSLFIIFKHSLVDQAALVGQTVGWMRRVKQTQTEGHDHRGSGFRVLGTEDKTDPQSLSLGRGVRRKRKRCRRRIIVRD